MIILKLIIFIIINLIKKYNVILLFYNNFYDILAILYTYSCVYNTSLVLFFWTLHQFINFNFKTIYSFNDFKFNNFYIIIISILLFSIAGIPPFLGFFTKLLILIALLNSHFIFFFFFFFTLLFFGLYFYLQNIRFLYSNVKNNLQYSYEVTLRMSHYYVYISIILLFILMFGIFFIDFFLLYFYWLLN